MSVLSAARTALAAQIDAATTVQVTPHPPGDLQAVRESIWLERGESTFEWRSLGIGPQLARNRMEEISIDLQVRVFKEGSLQTTAAAAAMARCEELLDAIEDAVAPAPDLGGVVSYGRIASMSVTPLATDSGWLIEGRARFEAQNHPS